MYLFFDCETTGFISKTLPPGDPKQAHICQLAAILSDDKGVELARMNHLIKPTNWVISEQLTAIHGISHAEAVEKGVPILDVLKEFETLVEKCSVLVAHNFNFDRDILALERLANGFESKFYTKSTCCTMLNSTEICKIPKARGSGYKWPKLQEIHKHLFGEEFTDAHDALADILATKRVFFEILRRETL